MRQVETAWQKVPSVGPLELGSVYRRAHLNDRFGGNRMSGIVASPKEPVVLLFHTKEPSQQFYKDGFDKDGIYWYSGEGTRGDMNWTPANRAIRDHMSEGKDLLLFERVQRVNGLWCLVHTMRYLKHQEEIRPDKEGKSRRAIVFGLIADHAYETTPNVDQFTEFPGTPLELRRAVENLVETQDETPAERIRKVYKRSVLVAHYARVRAAGKCEACGSDAPFETNNGERFLEVHHIDRLADGGADQFDKVAAVCPNCHRRIHFGKDGAEYNRELANRIATFERQRGLVVDVANPNG